MLKCLFSPPWRMSAEIENELLSLRHTAQVEALTLARHPADHGSGCGITGAAQTPVSPP